MVLRGVLEGGFKGGVGGWFQGGCWRVVLRVVLGIL